MLSPYRVLDLTDSHAQLGPMILADLGAEVIRIEPRGSDRHSGLYHVYNRGKKLTQCDIDTPEGKAQLLELVKSADFLFEDAGPGAMAARGLGYADLIQANPTLVYVAVSPFGQDGPYANHANTDLTLAAMGGMAALNGEGDRPPVRVTVPQCWHHGAAESAAAALVAHHRRLQTGEPQFVDVSVQAAVTWTAIQAMTSYGVQGKNMERAGTLLQLGVLTMPLVYPARDGEVVFAAFGGAVASIINWMIADGTVPGSWIDDDNWAQYDIMVLTGAPVKHPMEELLAKAAEFFAKYPKQELFNRGLRDGVTIAPVATLEDVLGFDHLEARNYWYDYELPGGRKVRIPGVFARPGRTPLHAPGPAPMDADPAPAARPAVGPLPAAKPGRLPFEGLKVADFSWIGVGPISAKYFADHGATVVRVETTNPPDRLRNAGPFKDGVAGVNRSQFFGMANSSKKGVVLDLKSAAGKKVAKQLLAWCDGAFESFTPGTMADLGLGYDVAKALNPEIIMVSTCLMGQTGPARSLAGFGYHAAAIAGFYEITGWPDRSPAGPFTAYTDVIAPHFLVATVAAALDHHRRTGEGQYIEQSQMEAALHFLAPELVEYQLSGAIPRRAGNDDPTMCPHAIFPSAGEDQWIAIACETDAQWAALAREMASAAPAGADLATFAGRQRRKDEIHAAVAAWSAAQDRYQLMARLQSAGVPAGPVQRSSDLLADPQLAHRRYFRMLEHPEMGMVPYEGHQFRIAGYDNGPRFAAPCLGEHTWEVLTELLGIEEGEAGELLAAGGVGL
ncbi:MAG: CoA transferase [Dehalococcoidia bacterium]|nr:CoA transferase [Dehalococcoidia bacterium]